MAKTANLAKAKEAKNDEFHTRQETMNGIKSNHDNLKRKNTIRATHPQP